MKIKPAIVDRPWFNRFWEIFPGAMTWSAILAPAIFAWFWPIALAYFIIAFDLFWMIKSLRLSLQLLMGYRKLHQASKEDWAARLEELDDIPSSIGKVERSLAHATGENRARLHQHLQELRVALDHKQVILDRKEIYHAVILAVYNEGIDTLEPSVEALTKVDYRLDRVMLVIAYEQRGGEATERIAKALVEKYGSKFAYAQAIMHPDGLPGEIRGKGANISYAGRRLTEKVLQMGIEPSNVVVTTLDADHRTSTSYFPYLSYVYATDPNRIRRSFQPIPMFFNNIWDVPAPMRVIATGNSFWMIMETMRPHRLRNFAAHAQSLQALIDTDYWSVTSIVEDGHQFWRTYFTYDGDHRVVPLFTPIYQDAVLAGGYWRTFGAQYLQLRRWAWGASDISFVVRNSIKNKRIKWSDKLVHLWRLFEGHFSWATAPLILTFAAWLPLVFNERFRDQLLAHQLPVIASRILTVAMIGLLVTVYISLISLPPRPARYRHTRLFGMIAQWVLLPFTAIVFSAFAAIDAQTRLMFGKYLDFRVTEKATKK